MKFGGFLICFNDVKTISLTLEQIFSQKVHPEKIWIVDNSITNHIENHFKLLDDSRFIYYKVGYNSGPAGGAAIGLKLVADAGYDWIYWGDDNDPPLFKETFEKLLSNINSTNQESVGIIGAVGHFFQRKTGKLLRTPDQLLKGDGFMEVDSVAGGQSMLINSKVIQNGILPNPKLFFGFEELDFCLNVKKAGFKILVHKEQFRKHREFHTKPEYFPSIDFPERNRLWRQYYSFRNLVVIFREHKFFLAAVYLIFRGIGKSLVSFRNGFNYGFNLSYRIILGLSDGFLGRLGNRSHSL